MIVESRGLDAITTGRQYRRLVRMLSHSFRDVEAEEVLGSMLGMKQYFWFQDHLPVAVVSFRDRGLLQCNHRHYANVLYNVATDPYYRRRGYMEKLLRHVVHSSHRQNKRCLNLETRKDNRPARHLYEKLGFAVAGSCEEKGIDRMRLCLKKRNNKKISE
jgi:ribosomal protein S18 acetylase RimI-like enzyme